MARGDCEKVGPHPNQMPFPQTKPPRVKYPCSPNQFRGCPRALMAMIRVLSWRPIAREPSRFQRIHNASRAFAKIPGSWSHLEGEFRKFRQLHTKWHGLIPKPQVRNWDLFPGGGSRFHRALCSESNLGCYSLGDQHAGGLEERLKWSINNCPGGLSDSSESFNCLGKKFRPCYTTSGTSTQKVRFHGGKTFVTPVDRIGKNFRPAT